MRNRIAAIGLLAVIAFFVAAAISHSSGTVQQAGQKSTAPVKASPAEGYNVHVLAPHMVDGKQMAPYHHYCKVLAPDPEFDEA